MNKEVEIKLLTPILINGLYTKPGVIKVDKFLAINLVTRKRAIYVAAEDKEENKEELTLDRLKEIAEDLNIKFNVNIGLPALSKKINDFLEENAKELNVEFSDLDIEKSYAAYKEASKVEETEKVEDDADELQKVKDVADAAKIEYPEDIKLEELNAKVELELEQYASELKIDVPENANIFETWELIKNNIKNV